MSPGTQFKQMICENPRSASLEEIEIVMRAFYKGSSSVIFIFDNFEKVPVRRTGAYCHKKRTG